MTRSLIAVCNRLASSSGVEGRLGFPHRFAPVVAYTCKQLLRGGGVPTAYGQVSHDIAFVIGRSVQRFGRCEASLHAWPRQGRGLSSVAAVNRGGDLKIHRVALVAANSIGDFSCVS